MTDVWAHVRDNFVPCHSCVGPARYEWSVRPTLSRPEDCRIRVSPGGTSTVVRRARGQSKIHGNLPETAKSCLSVVVTYVMHGIINWLAHFNLRISTSRVFLGQRPRAPQRRVPPTYLQLDVTQPHPVCGLCKLRPFCDCLQILLLCIKLPASALYRRGAGT